MPDLTPLEAAENLERMANLCTKDCDLLINRGHTKYLYSAASYLRKIASGEYAPVVHAHWVRINNTQEQMCSNCGQSYDIYAYRQDDYKYCPSCGAMMDGKGDSA